MKIKEKTKQIKGKILKYIAMILFIVMLVLIYIVSPRITKIIQNLAKYLYDIESDYITRVVQLILSVSFAMTVVTTFKKDK